MNELIEEVVLLRQQYFPHAKGCNTETLQQLLALLFRDGKQSVRSTADKWMVVYYYEEESVYDRTTKTRRIEKCRGCFYRIICRSVSRVLVHGLLVSDANALIDRHFHTHFHIVDFMRLIDSCRGTLSPMNPLISEFQIPISNVLENMHVISDSQLMVVTVDRSIHNIPLSSSYQFDFSFLYETTERDRTRFSKKKSSTRSCSFSPPFPEMSSSSSLPTATSTNATRPGSSKASSTVCAA